MTARHRARRSRPRRLGPVRASAVAAVAGGLVFGAVAGPQLVRALPDALRHEVASPLADAPTTTTTVTALGPGPSVLRLQVVPAVRDVEVEVDGRTYTSGPTGLVEAPTDGPEADVRFVGYSVTPAVQEVVFSEWGDGSGDASRTIPATGPDDTVDVGVEVRYRVTLTGPATGETTLSDGEDDVVVPVDEPTWLAAVRSVPARGDRLMPAPVTYRPGTAADPTGPPFALAPEAIHPVA